MLCQTALPIKNSHVLPKFAVKWLKENCSPYLRSAGAPNKRVQDTPKEPLLCLDCEGRFARWEDAFATCIFKPYNANRRIPEFSYGSWLLYFVVSISWRLLAVQLEELREREPAMYPYSVEAFEHWRLFLLGKSQTSNPYEHKMFFVSTIERAPEDVPLKMNSYLLRGLDGSTVSTDNQQRVYSLIPGIIFWSAVYPPRMRGWPDGSSIKRKGSFKVSQNVADELFGRWTLDRAKDAFKLPLSEKQQDKIGSDMKRILSTKSVSEQVRMMEPHFADRLLREMNEHDN